MSTPLSVLDLAPIVSGGTAGDALRRTLDLARHAEKAGYHRYWVAEHHFTPGVASSQPALLLGQIAAVTERIRLGSGAVQTGHQTALTIVEQFGLLDALYPGRFDLGLGRSGQRRTEPAEEPPPIPAHITDGLLIPEHFSFAPILGSSRSAFRASLLQQPGAQAPDLATVLDDITKLLTGAYPEARAIPGEGAQLDIWILGSSGGESAHVAGERGLPFAANYHVAPAKVLEAVGAYRKSFKPSENLGSPYVMVSADVIVAADDATARELSAPYGQWVHSIRAGGGAIPYPTLAEARAHSWTEDERRLVADRVDTQFTGSPATVAAQLRTLQKATGADELLITTMTPEHDDRVRSFDLLAEEWHH